jgi:hypothetical protein
MRWFVQRVALLLLGLALVAGVAWWFVARQTIDFAGILQPRVPAPNGIEDWEIDLLMSSASTAYLNRALEPGRDRSELEVELLITSHPTKVFRGKLHRDTLRLEDGHGRAKVRIHPVNGDIPAEDRVPDHLLLSRVEVHARVFCR